MVVAYVLLKLSRGGEVTIEKAVKKMSGVIDVATLYGEYDAILKIQKKSMEDLQSFLVKELRRVDGISQTSTLITNN
jgi:DNA-binding Lrp family transcriptional regulator